MKNVNNNFRYLLAGFLIFLIILLQPIYLKWLGYESDPVPYEAVEAVPMHSEIIISPDPPVKDKIVDSVGAGDALLAYATLSMLATKSIFVSTIFGFNIETERKSPSRR